MADKAVSELTPATQVTATDLFVLEQNGEAKKLTGQTLENWLLEMAEGKGGIQSIQKVASSGLVDTYMITFSDTSTFTYTVTNGEKGEQGEKTYIWIKYSDNKPTSNADIYDTPDNWIGIYVGTASAAPVGYTQYTWFNIKGETGPTGAAAVLQSSSVTYQASDSGTVIPSGTWSSSIPPVNQGKYLWTKCTFTFNSGEPITQYSVARMGVDGSGSVVSVNNISPDEYGNINVTAKSLGLSGLMKRKLVWENASPDSDFGATTVTLSAAQGLNVVNWDIVYIMVKGNHSAMFTESTEYGASGHRANFTIYSSTINVCIRQCAQNGLTFSFETAKSNGNEYPSSLIPYQIYANYLNQEE